MQLSPPGGEDDYTRSLEEDRGTALWRARLSDGSVAVQDDGRPGTGGVPAWVRLAAHLGRAGLSLTALWLQFRGHHARHLVPDGAEGYYFSRSVLSRLGGGGTAHFYLLGHLEGDTIRVRRVGVPDLIPVDSFEREPLPGDPRLIRNPNPA